MQAGPAHRGGCSSPLPPPEELALPDALAAPPPTATAAGARQSMYELCKYEVPDRHSSLWRAWAASLTVHAATHQ